MRIFKFMISSVIILGFSLVRADAMEDRDFYSRAAHSPTYLLEPRQEDGVIIYTQISDPDAFQKAKTEGLKSSSELKGKRDSNKTFANHDDCIFFRPPGYFNSTTSNIIGIRVNPAIRVANQIVRGRSFSALPRTFSERPINKYSKYYASSVLLEEYERLKTQNSNLSPPKLPYSVTYSGYLVWLTKSEAVERSLNGTIFSWAPEIAIQVPFIPPEEFAFVSESPPPAKGSK